MVAVTDLPWQDPANGNSPTTSHRQHWQQAVARIAENLTVALHAGDRLTKALDLVLTNTVAIRPDGTAQVCSGNHTYTVTTIDGCTCEDARHRTRFCKHYLAVLIHRRATALLQGTQYAEGQEASEEVTKTVTPKSAAWQLYEAPAACTLKFTCNGVDIALTMRDVSDDALFTRVQRVLPKIYQKIQTPPKG